MRHITFMAEIHLEDHFRQLLDRSSVGSCLQTYQSFATSLQQKVRPLHSTPGVPAHLFRAVSEPLHANGLLRQHSKKLQANGSF